MSREPADKNVHPTVEDKPQLVREIWAAQQRDPSLIGKLFII
jgi:hypothetical protein